MKTLTPIIPSFQISMTASVYTTVVTCFDRYIAICRPALLGCCGRSEDNTSWALIAGTAVFSVLYNVSRFFEYTAVMVEAGAAGGNSSEALSSTEVVSGTVFVRNFLLKS